MARVCFYTLLICLCLIYGCRNKVVINYDTITSAEATAEIYSEFIDSVHIGVKGRNKLILQQYDMPDSLPTMEIFFFEKNGDDWVQLQQFVYERNPILNVKDAIVQDYNNDGFGDFTYPSDVAARGSNEIMKLFVYSPSDNKLVYIRNSEYYPNLQYNEELDCLDAFAVYGGTTTFFLKIDADTLKPFATVDMWDNHMRVTEIDENGNEVILKEDTVTDGPYIRYKNYNPIEEKD